MNRVRPERKCTTCPLAIRDSDIHSLQLTSAGIQNDHSTGRFGKAPFLNDEIPGSQETQPSKRRFTDETEIDEGLTAICPS